MTVYRVSCSITLPCMAKKRTAPVGCVGRRFHHDSLGSHVCLHLYGPKKPRDPPSLTTPNSITWACGAAKFTLNKCKEEEKEEEGEVVTIYAIELLKSDSDYTSFF